MKNLRAGWKTIKARWKSKTPEFWQKTQARCLKAAATLTPLLVLELGDTSKIIVGALIVFLTGIAAAAQLTCDDAPAPAPTSSPDGQES